MKLHESADKVSHVLKVKQFPAGKHNADRAKGKVVCFSELLIELNCLL